MKDKIDFLDFFKKIPDHRINRHKLYSVEEILLLTFCAVIAGCNSWEDMELFGTIKQEELQRYLPFAHGTPSDDTLRRFFRALDPKSFESSFMSWVKSFQLGLNNKVIAIDGKTSKGSLTEDKPAMHMVSAFASELGITLGQVKTKEKSNEITAIPELLNLLDISGAVVTIDAMGCQHKIADNIIQKDANYVLALKGNQSALQNDVLTLFEHPPKDMEFHTCETNDKGHGRLETRSCKASSDIDWLREVHPKWKKLTSIVEIESTRTIKGKTSIEKRHYISSLNDAPAILNATREHWGIENKLHWVLDVTFDDDKSRIRKGNAPQNMAIIKKTSLNLMRIIKQNPDHKRLSLKRMRKLAGWDNNFLKLILEAKF